MITRFMWIQAEMWDNAHELPPGLHRTLAHSLGSKVGCTCQKWFMLLKILLFGQPQKAPVGTLEGCCALEKLSPALLPVSSTPLSSRNVLPGMGEMEISSFPLVSATGTAQLQRALESQLTPDEPCHKIITIKTIQEYESCESLTSSESKGDLF